MSFVKDRRYLIAGIIVVIILAVSLFFILQPKTELNTIGSQYVTIKGQTLDNGDFRVELEILQPANIQIDEWHSWVEGTTGYKSPLKSGVKSGVYAYTLDNVSTQGLSIFLTIGGKETIFNEMFTDFFVNQFDHVVPEIVIGETTTVPEETKEPSPLAKFFGATPGFELYLITIPMLLLIIYKRRKNDAKNE